MRHPLFIYGTLHPDRAPAIIADTARRLKPLARATIRGRMYDLGAYPGVIFASGDDAGATIAGELFSLPDGDDAEAVLARLDDYEDFCSDDPESSLFLRQTTTATMADGGTVVCWVYTYNRSSLESVSPGQMQVAIPR